MTTVHDTEVDGVRCFWVDSGRPTLAAALVFRQGLADEPLLTAGWLHMLEHLALHGTGGGTLHVNGAVSMLHTTFDAHGPADAVSRHLGHVTNALGMVERASFEKERGVLIAEARRRGTSSGARALGWRFGARGPGVVNYDEPGLVVAAPDDLAARAAGVFTRENAVLVLDGPPPGDLSLTLPHGRPLSTTPATPCDDELPAMYVDDSGLMMSGLVPRSPAAAMLPGLLQEMLTRRLRHEAGAAYSPWADYLPVDDETAVLMGGSDVNRDLLPTLAPTALEMIASWKNDGVDAARLEEELEQFRQVTADPYNGFGVAFRAAHAVMNGREPQSLEEILAESRTITAETLQPAVDAFADSLLLGVPGDTTWNDELPRLQAPVVAARPTGARFRHVDWPAVPHAVQIADDAVYLGSGSSHQMVKVDDIAAMFTFADGGRHLVTHDGWGISVDTDTYRRGDRALALLDRVVPADRRVPMPVRDWRQTYKRASAWSRWRAGAQRFFSTRRGTWTLLVAGVLFIVGLVAIKAWLAVAIWLFVIGMQVKKLVKGSDADEPAAGET